MDTTTKEKKLDPTRRNTSDKINKEIDEKTLKTIEQYQNTTYSGDINRRLEQLETEWDIDRTLMANASTLSLAGVIMGTTINKKWYILPGVVTTFLLWHAIQGWCPPLPLFRKLGFRTRKEIDTEKFALKALRGDFESLNRNEIVSNEIMAERVLHAVKK